MEVHPIVFAIDRELPLQPDAGLAILVFDRAIELDRQTHFLRYSPNSEVRDEHDLIALLLHALCLERNHWRLGGVEEVRPLFDGRLVDRA